MHAPCCWLGGVKVNPASPLKHGPSRCFTPRSHTHMKIRGGGDPGIHTHRKMAGRSRKESYPD